MDIDEIGYVNIDGNSKKLYFFSMVLGYSRKKYIEFTTDISTENVIKMYINAFHYFGRYTDTILYDYIKIVPERKINASELTFNKDFLDFAEYYGIIRSSWLYRPQTKGKIENTIKYVRNSFFKVS